MRRQETLSLLPFRRARLNSRHSSYSLRSRGTLIRSRGAVFPRHVSEASQGFVPNFLPYLLLVPASLIHSTLYHSFLAARSN